MISVLQVFELLHKNKTEREKNDHQVLFESFQLKNSITFRVNLNGFFCWAILIESDILIQTLWDKSYRTLQKEETTLLLFH